MHKNLTVGSFVTIPLKNRPLTDHLIIQVNNLNPNPENPQTVAGKAVYPPEEVGNPYIWHVGLIKILADTKVNPLLEGNSAAKK